MENPESQATQYQRKKIKQISGMENPESQATQVLSSFSGIVLPVTLDSPFFIVYSVLSEVFFKKILHYNPKL
jgi:hypothetical protein